MVLRRVSQHHSRLLAKSFQFRDLRAKAATDAGDLAHSQKLCWGTLLESPFKLLHVLKESPRRPIIRQHR